MITHPSYDGLLLRKYRLVYTESDAFIDRYLVKRYNEVYDAWKDRRGLSYNPAFAREAVDEFARAMVQRSSEIKRIGGHPLYLQQVRGLKGGMDRQHSTMDAFNATHVIGELMAMASVGIYVDNDPFQPKTLAEETRPYLYTYKAEDILNWRYVNGELVTVVLRDWYEELDDSGLPSSKLYRYRRLDLVPEGVKVSFINTDGDIERTLTLDLPMIPFVHLKLSQSLLKDTARYQIALLNVASAGTYQVWAANFPLYTQQYNPFTDLMKKDEEIEPEKARKLEMGTMTGIEYPQNTERPAWIHPSSEPLRATQAYMDQMKEEIRQLTALAITNLSPKMASAESKAQDRMGLESGLSVIGMTLQTGENKISEIWHQYKGGKPAEIHYPEKYELLGESERRETSKELKELQHAVPSRTFQKETAKTIAETLHGHRVPHEILQKIQKEIEESPVPTADPDVLRSDHESGFVSDATASIGRGYEDDEAEKAREDHALRIARIQAAQTSAVISDMDPNPDSGKDQKELSQDPTKTDTGEKLVRGEGK